MSQGPPLPHEPLEGTARVLVVEREGASRELEGEFLQALGLLVEFTADGSGAWERIMQSLPDLVLTEILLPRLDGLALCRRIKSTPETQHIRVLIVSMLAASSRARDASADAFLMKPITQARLHEEVTRLVPAAAPDRERERA